MTKNAKIIIGAIVAVVIIGGIWYGAGRKPAPIETEKEPIKIGFIAPLSGEAASYGEFVVKAFKLAIEDYNSTHKNLNFEVIYEDGKCDGSQAVTAINKLINVDKIKYVIGGLCSSETLAMVPVAESNKIILFSPGSGSPDITNAGDYIFRNLASDDYTAKEIAKIAIRNNDKEIGLITENLDYPQTLKKAFKDYYTSQGGIIKLDETFNPGETDFRTIITKAKFQNVNQLYLVAQTYKTTALILKQMKELNYNPKLYTNEVTVSEEALKYYDSSYKGLVEGAIFTQPKFDESNPRASDVLAKFKEKYGSNEGPIPPVYIATYYDSVYLLGEAIEKVGDNPDKIKDYFYTVKNWEGAVGKFSFDQNGDAVTDVEAKTVKNGEIVSF
ncbi:ABC transporter substrate-binding protein [Candidatus Parcubacteria bacterium]|nr:ABC transporter substrate-binding protein [Candidatus Parcubacteria bacterium]